MNSLRKLTIPGVDKVGNRKLELGYVILICVCSVFGFSHAQASDVQKTAVQTPELTSESDLASILDSDAGVSLFTAALKLSEVWKRVQSAGSATVFAPVDTALRQEGSAFLLNVVLIKPENAERLNNLLAQHFIPNHALKLGDLNSPVELTDGNGGCVAVSPLFPATRVGPEAYISHSIETSNGIIHYIDRLLWNPYNKIARCP